MVKKNFFLFLYLARFTNDFKVRIFCENFNTYSEKISKQVLGRISCFLRDRIKWTEKSTDIRPGQLATDLEWPASTWENRTKDPGELDWDRGLALSRWITGVLPPRMVRNVSFGRSVYRGIYSAKQTTIFTTAATWIGSKSKHSATWRKWYIL